jgi:hypothetical protein
MEKRHGSVGNRTTTLAQNERCCGFESRLSHWGTAEYANRQSGQAQTLVIDCGFDSRLCDYASAGHWRAQVAVTHPHCCAGSTPARRTDMARWSIGSRTPASHAGGRGSIPLRATGLVQAGRCPADPHKVSTPGSIPGPATGSAEYANRQSGHLEGVVTLWVRLPPRLLWVPWCSGTACCPVEAEVRDRHP